MMYKHTQNGQPLKIDANMWNDIQQTTKKELEKQLEIRACDTVPVVSKLDCRNDSGNNLPQFSIVGVSDATILPSDNEVDFYYRPSVNGVVPTADHFLKFAVIQEPLGKKAMGAAVSAGFTPIKVKKGNCEDGKFARVVCGQTDYVELCEDGPITIIWMDDEQANGYYGLYWAYVRIDRGWELLEFELDSCLYCDHEPTAAHGNCGSFLVRDNTPNHEWSPQCATSRGYCWKNSASDDTCDTLQTYDILWMEKPARYINFSADFQDCEEEASINSYWDGYDPMRCASKIKVRILFLEDCSCLCEQTGIAIYNEKETCRRMGSGSSGSSGSCNIEFVYDELLKIASTGKVNSVYNYLGVRE